MRFRHWEGLHYCAAVPNVKRISVDTFEFKVNDFIELVCWGVPAYGHPMWLYRHPSLAPAQSATVYDEKDALSPLLASVK